MEGTWWMEKWFGGEAKECIFKIFGKVSKRIRWIFKKKKKPCINEFKWDIKVLCLSNPMESVWKCVHKI